ncbi:MAG: hypothetical protein PHN51_11755 [Candidatus Nanopelagicales bacterium]|nr:hypothetical protein [Candidatus Nanopelagicales bacterium]
MNQGTNFFTFNNRSSSDRDLYGIASLLGGATTGRQKNDSSVVGAGAAVAEEKEEEIRISATELEMIGQVAEDLFKNKLSRQEAIVQAAAIVGPANTAVLTAVGKRTVARIVADIFSGSDSAAASTESDNNNKGCTGTSSAPVDQAGPSSSVPPLDRFEELKQKFQSNHRGRKQKKSLVD